MTPDEINQKWPHEATEVAGVQAPQMQPQTQPQPEMPPMAEPPTPEEPKSKKKMFMIVGIVVVVLALAAAGIFAFMQMNKTVDHMAVEVLSPSPEAMEDKMEDEMSDWEIYMGGGYSLKYPKGEYTRIICPGDESDNFYLTVSNEGQTGPIISSTCARDSSFALELSFPESETERLAPDYEKTTEEILIDDVNATKSTYKQINSTPGSSWYVLVSFKNNGTNYQLKFTGKCGSTNDISQMALCANELDQILSTFQFTGPSKAQ
jgi:hypothetical protein